MNEVGPGLDEKVYENGLAVVFRLNGVAFDPQRRFPVLFRGIEGGEFVPGLMVFNSVIADAKVIERITGHAC